MTDPAPDWADEEALACFVASRPLHSIAAALRAAYERGKAERTLRIGELDALTITHMEGYQKGKRDGERSGIIKGLREADNIAQKAFREESPINVYGMASHWVTGIQNAIRSRIAELEKEKP